MFATIHLSWFVFCHVVIFAETTDHRDLEKEEALEIIIRAGENPIEEDTLSFLNDNDGGMEEERDHHGSDDGRMEEEQDHDGFGDIEKGALTTIAESGEVYIYIHIY